MYIGGVVGVIFEFLYGKCFCFFCDKRMTLALIRITLQLLLYCILPSNLDAASSLRAPRLQWRHHVSSTDAPSQHIVHPAPSKFTFSWVNPLFNIGNRELEIRDLWSVINDTSAVTHYFQGNGSSTASHTNTSLVQAYRQSPLFANLLQRYLYILCILLNALQ